MAGLLFAISYGSLNQEFLMRYLSIKNRTVPRELEAAAMIDGVSQLGIMLMSSPDKYPLQSYFKGGIVVGSVKG